MTKCDFCSELNPPHVFDATTYTATAEAGGVMVDIGRSIDGWYACDGCAELIQRDAWPELEQRCYERVCLPLRIPEQEGRMLLRQLHAGFRKHRAETITE